jgi:hypothetical protein
MMTLFSVSSATYRPTCVRMPPPPPRPLTTGPLLVFDFVVILSLSAQSHALI